jgi:hypothetical protein
MLKIRRCRCSLPSSTLNPAMNSGAPAARALPPRCELDGERTYDRCVGICYLQDEDISEGMVRRGLARDCPRFSGGRYAQGRTPGRSRGRDDRQELCPARVLSAALRRAMATDQLIVRDARIRQAAFDHVHGMQSRDLVLSHDDVARGFMFEGQRWPLWTPNAACPSS